MTTLTLIPQTPACIHPRLKWAMPLVQWRWWPNDRGLLQSTLTPLWSLWWDKGEQVSDPTSPSERNVPKLALFPGLPVFFVIQFALKIIHRSGKSAWRKTGKFFAALLLPCIIVNANWRTKHGVGLAIPKWFLSKKKKKYGDRMSGHNAKSEI